jgi:hypothetical protein
MKKGFIHKTWEVTMVSLEQAFQVVTGENAWSEVIQAIKDHDSLLNVAKEGLYDRHQSSTWDIKAKGCFDIVKATVLKASGKCPVNIGGVVIVDYVEGAADWERLNPDLAKQVKAAKAEAKELEMFKNGYLRVRSA